jgi:hypothetical protein
MVVTTTLVYVGILLLPMLLHVVILCQRYLLLSFMWFHYLAFMDLVLLVMIVITFDFMCLLGTIVTMIYTRSPKEPHCAYYFM